MAQMQMFSSSAILRLHQQVNVTSVINILSIMSIVHTIQSTCPMYLNQLKTYLY